MEANRIAVQIRELIVLWYYVRANGGDIMEAVALRNEAHKCIEDLPDEKLPTLISFIKTMNDELTLYGKTLDDLTPEWREIIKRRHDPTFWSRPFKTAEEAVAALLAEGEDEFDA